ncbi:hypothetical protein SRHO_G00050740 [Serrasalmus rhombeus]
MNATGQARGIKVGQQWLGVVESFTYVDGAVFQNGEMWRLNLFTSIVMPTVTYTSKTWKASTNINNKPPTTIRCLYPVLKFWYYDHIFNKEVLQRSGKWYLHVIITWRRL